MRNIAFTLVLLIFSTSTIYAQAEAEVEEITFFMTFVPNVQFSQMYVGMEKGYFGEAGYALTLEYGNEPDGVELIALGERQYGLIAGEQVILARANERPVISVYEWWQRNPIVLVTDADSGIETPADFAGRTVGVPGRFGATYSGLVAFLAANDLSESDINLQEIGFNAPEVVCVGGVEASAVYGNNEPLQIEQRVEADDCNAVTDVRTFAVADYTDLVSNGLVTNEMLIAEQPERVRAMVAAFDQAVNDVINNPFEAYLLSESYIDNLPMTDALRSALQAASARQQQFLTGDFSPSEVATSRSGNYDLIAGQFTGEELLQLDVLMETIQLWEAQRTGLATLNSWEVTQETLLQMGFLDEPIDVSQAFTNDFLP